MFKHCIRKNDVVALYRYQGRTLQFSIVRTHVIVTTYDEAKKTDE